MTMPAVAVIVPRPHWRRMSAALGLLLLATFAVVGVLHDSIAPHDRGASNPSAAALAPDAVHILGTDQLGRDVLSETIHALGVSMGDAALGFAVALVFGTLAGLMAAHLLGRLGATLRVIAGVVAAVPVLLLAILLVVLTGSSFAAFAAGFAAAPAQFARSFDRTRALLSSQQTDYARASGITPAALFRRDLTHSFVAALVSLSARAFASVAITLATMSFFGFGAAPPARDLGLMIASAALGVDNAIVDSAWWAAAFPAAMLVLVVLAANLAAAFSDDRA